MAYQMAIIGYGGMGGWHHERLAKCFEKIKVTGMYDIRPESREKAAQKGLYVYATAEALLADPAVDVVLVATPNNFHKHYVIAALEAGKNVICEKPVAMNAAELQEMIAAAQRTGKLFSIHQNRRWDTDYRIVREILSGGAIGTPYFIESRVLGSRRAMHGWRSYKVDGGGMLLDWGVHLIDQALWLIDSPVVAVDANLQSIFSGEVDDSIKVVLRFENGVSYLTEMSTNCLIPQPRWHISCTGGTAVIEDWDCHGKIVTLREDGPMQWDNDIVYTAAGPTRTMAPRPVHTMKEQPLPPLKSDSIAYYENIAAVLDGMEDLIVTPQQALRVMQVIDLAFASNEQRHGLACHI
ncbi:MAG: Gfo/Idh/MocA family oxidoreductase [Gemmiger sp.]|nr:Gfo/Idh/MocA family oxidoreductase [Gemmiger sp.]